MSRVANRKPCGSPLKGPTADTFYANVAGSPLVFTVGGPQIQPLLAEFRDQRVLSFPAAKVIAWSCAGPLETLEPRSRSPATGGPSAWKPLPGSEGIRFDLSRLDAPGERPGQPDRPPVHPVCRPLPGVGRADSSPAGDRGRPGGRAGTAHRSGSGTPGRRRRALRHRRARERRGRSSSSPTRDGPIWSRPPEAAGDLPEDVFAP